MRFWIASRPPVAPLASAVGGEKPAVTTGAGAAATAATGAGAAAPPAHRVCCRAIWMLDMRTLDVGCQWERALVARRLSAKWRGCCVQVGMPQHECRGLSITRTLFMRSLHRSGSVQTGLGQEACKGAMTPSSHLCVSYLDPCSKVYHQHSCQSHLTPVHLTSVLQCSPLQRGCSSLETQGSRDCLWPCQAWYL